jgi:hypothetical protein
MWLQIIICDDEKLKELCFLSWCFQKKLDMRGVCVHVSAESSYILGGFMRMFRALALVPDTATLITN